jgi:hypothetical protein
VPTDIPTATLGSAVGVHIRAAEAYTTSTRRSYGQKPCSAQNPGRESPAIIHGASQKSASEVMKRNQNLCATMMGSMIGVERALRGSPGRRSRLHTLRGELVPSRALAGLPWLVANRLAGRDPDGPWFNTLALRFLNDTIQPHWKVFEFGSGRSTLWYARHAASVVALESTPHWHAKVNEMVSRYANATVELMPARGFPSRIALEPDDTFDLIVVDGPDQDESGNHLPVELDRTGCVIAALAKVRPGGILLLDNSDRPQYRRIDATLADWHQVRLSGFSTKPLTPLETTLYWRPRPQPPGLGDV